MKLAATCAILLVAACWAVPPAAAAEPLSIEDFDATWQAKQWTFSNGGEFPGAKGSFERSKEAAHGGEFGGRLAFDFTGGGNYVAAVRRLDGASEIAAVRLWVKKPPGNRLTFRYTDSTGQTLQKHFDAPDGVWAEATIRMGGWALHWGGANDGVPHGPPRMIAFNIDNTGQTQGALLFDDVRLVPGKPGEKLSSEYAAAHFWPAEEWHLSTSGPAGKTKLDGRTLQFDFTKGATSIGVAPREYSLMGLPKELRIRVRGKAAGHPVRVQFVTHFMTFEKTAGPIPESGELVIPCPPGEGWLWHGGENDGKIHGPLRLRGIWLEAGGQRDAGELELIEVRAKCEYDANRACVFVAERRESDGGGSEFVATLRSLSPAPATGTVAWTIRDWSGRTVAEGKKPVTIPPAGEPVEIRVPAPAGNQPFLEAEFTVDAGNQTVPPALAYYVAPPEVRGDADLDPASPFGMGLYLNRYPGSPEGLKEMDRAAQLGQDAGVKWSREDISWGRVERKKGEFDWTYYDQLVATAKRHGISIYGIIAYFPGWTKAYSPEGIEDYCRFLAAAVARYKGDVHHWEIWNEPNIFFWQGPKDMYADLLKQAYAAVKKADPTAHVLGCSTAGIDHKFIKRTIELGGEFDILTIHPYRATLSDRNFLADLAKAADTAKRPDGTPRPVWITEMGWTTCTPHNGPAQDFQPTTERDQARLLARAYLDAIASGAAPNISWYDFRNDGTDPFNFEHNMGIVTRDFRLKPAYRAYATLARLLKGKRTGKSPDLGQDMIAYRFADADGRRPLLALWAEYAERTVTIPAARAATLTDLMGGVQTLQSKDGKVTITLLPGTPVLLSLEP
ncbi:MAG: hypothetical protein NT049_08860 [Planctomycetota bacterium]|nr:hypothetical protein [Planctomycetota bacterium]